MKLEWIFKSFNIRNHQLDRFRRLSLSEPISRNDPWIWKESFGDLSCHVIPWIILHFFSLFTFFSEFHTKSLPWHYKHDRSSDFSFWWPCCWSAVPMRRSHSMIERALRVPWNASSPSPLRCATRWCSRNRPERALNGCLWRPDKMDFIRWEQQGTVRGKDINCLRKVSPIWQQNARLAFLLLNYWGYGISHYTTLIARFMGATWGPSGADRTQVSPMLTPWTLLSGYPKGSGSIQYDFITRAQFICRLIVISHEVSFLDLTGYSAAIEGFWSWNDLQDPLLLTWFDINPSTYKKLHPLYSVRWNYYPFPNCTMHVITCPC